MAVLVCKKRRIEKQKIFLYEKLTESKIQIAAIKKIEELVKLPFKSLEKTLIMKIKD